MFFRKIWAKQFFDTSNLSSIEMHISKLSAIKLLKKTETCAKMMPFVVLRLLLASKLQSTL